MTTITLEDDLAQQVEDFVRHSHAQVEMADIVEQALRQYLRQMGQRKIHRETQAFEQQKATLLKQYLGQYVAVHDGEVIDHDRDLRQLNQRVFKRLGRTPVLHKKVTDTPEQDILTRSPRWERTFP